MHRVNFFLFFQKRYAVFISAAFFSIILSIWSSAQQSVINPDAICYLNSASAFSVGFSFATHLCDQAKWPLYSLFIFLLSKMISVSVTTSAFLLNGLFSLMSVLFFIAIIRLMDKTPRLLWLAAGVILMAHTLNDVRQYIVRDHGFWAFYLASLFFLLQYFRFSSWRYALAWSSSLLIATLFRVEGSLFLLFIPWIVFFDFTKSGLSRLKCFFQLNSLILLLIVIASVWLISHPQFQLGRLNELEFQFLYAISIIIQNFHVHSHALALNLLNGYSARDAGWILFLLLLAWYVVSVIMNVSIIYAILIIYAGWKKIPILTSSTRLAWWGYVVISIVTTFIFLAEHFFLSKRYLIGLSLLLMMWVPFALNTLLQKKQKWIFIVAVFFMLISALGGIFDFGYSKKYIQAAGEWLTHNTPASATIYSNDLEVMYYSNRFGYFIFEQSKLFSTMKKEQWKKYDYIALRVDKKQSDSLSVKPIIVFSNKRGDQVRIYRGGQR